jgi:hypothetical protein
VDTHGIDVQVVNVSRTGLLVVSSMKIAPDSTVELRLHGLEQRLAVPARVVRSEVASIDSRGVTYHAAASFAGELPLIPELPGTLKQPLDAHDLATLLERATAAISNGEEVDAVRAMFEHELGLLLPAHDIAIRRKPVPTPEGESVYFQVPGNRLSILQVTFPSGHTPSSEEFALLKTAAATVGLFQSRLRWRHARNAW